MVNVWWNWDCCLHLAKYKIYSETQRKWQQSKCFHFYTTTDHNSFLVRDTGTAKLHRNLQNHCPCAWPPQSWGCDTRIASALANIWTYDAVNLSETLKKSPSSSLACVWCYFCDLLWMMTILTKLLSSHISRSFERFYKSHTYIQGLPGYVCLCFAKIMCGHGGHFYYNLALLSLKVTWEMWVIFCLPCENAIWNYNLGRGERQVEWRVIVCP